MPFITLLRRWRFTLPAAATLALGIAGFSVIHALAGVILRPLPYPGADRLVAVFQVQPGLRGRAGMERLWDSFGHSYLTWQAIRQGVPAFEAVGAMSASNRVLTGSGPAEPIEVLRVSAAMPAMLGAAVALGRGFVAGEDAPPGTPVALISDAAWRSRFGARADIIGQTVVLDGTTHQIVGVLARGARLPSRPAPPVWIPIGSDADDARPGKTPLMLVARLRPGATLEAASAQAAAAMAALAPVVSASARVGVWREELTRRIRRPIQVLLVAAMTLLGMACLSVAGLMLTDLRDRAGEFRTRGALGASLGAMIAQLVREAVAFGILAAAAGTMLALMVFPAARAFGASAMPQLMMSRLDARVIAASAAIAVLTAAATAAAAGLAVIGPWALGRSRRGAAPGRRFAGNQLIAAGQFALVTVLLICSGLLTLNLSRTMRVDPGFEPRGLLIATIDIGSDAQSAAAAEAFFEQLGARLARVPEIAGTEVASAIPFSGGNSSGALSYERAGAVDTIDARFSSVLPGYLEALGLRLLAGRLIGPADAPGSQRVAVINEAMARRLGGRGAAIGRSVIVGSDRFEVVGVVSDLRHASLIAEPAPTVYRAERQSHSRYLQLMARTRCGTDRDCLGRAAGAIREGVAGVSASAVVRRLDPAPDLVQSSFADARLRSTLIQLFAGMALLLTLIGVYETTLRLVRRARREIAIRIALGSTSGRAFARFVAALGQAAFAGTLVGALIAWWASRALRPWLPMVPGTEAWLFGLVALGLTGGAMGIAWAAARAVAKVDPAVVLKSGTA